MISEHGRVEATLGLTKEWLDVIKDGVIGNDTLSIEDISTLYRSGTMARLLNTPPAVLLQVITLFGIALFRYTTSCLQFFELWKQMEAAGLSTGDDDALQTLGLSKVALDKGAKGIKGNLETAGALGLVVELSDVPAEHVTVDLIFNTLSEAHRDPPGTAAAQEDSNAGFEYQR